ncbi:hypothetical protein [Streptomyces paludis]|uniref:hypothetical protein n=1 Tax=Streptomyces paludis TaxID=2282738 RepID=UPI001E331DC0|nr:hypothetical protein [Streptomyces paludis]
MTSQTPEKSPSRKQKLQEKQRRQLAVVDTIDKAEAKLRKAKVELAEAVAEAVDVFGGEQNASDELGLPLETIRGHLDLIEGDGAAEETADSPEAAAVTPAKAKAASKAEAKPESEPELEPEPALV